MFNLGTIGAVLTLEDQEFQSKINGAKTMAEGSFSGLTSMVKKMAVAAAGYFAFTKVKDFASDSVKLYSDAMEAAQKFDVVFSSLSGTGPAGELGKASQAAKEMQENYDMAEITAKSTLSATGDLLTGFGFTQEKALELSLQAAKLGADLASFSNYAGGAEGATNALTKGMLGETEMMKQLGIVVRQNDPDFMKLVKSIMATEGATLNEARAQAVLLTAIKQSPNAIGDYARTSGSLANQMKLTGERMKDLKLRVGEFIVGLTNLGGANVSINDMLKSITDVIAANSLEWIYYTRTAANVILTGLSGAWQVLLPVFAAGSEIIGTGFRNIWEMGKWAFENLGTIFSNFGDIIAGVWQDAVQNTKAFFSLILESAATVGSSLWGLITGKMSLDDVKEKFAGLADSAIDMIANSSKNTERAMANAGVSEMPDFEFPDLKKAIEDFSNINENIDKENLKGLQRQMKIDEDYTKAKLGLNKEEESGKTKAAPDKAKEEIEKGKDTTGSFSAAIVAAMFGRAKPEEEIARNTKDMRISLQRMEKKPALTF